MDDAPPDYDEPPYDDGPPPRRAGSGAPTKGRVPPHNLAAEESLLGAMLLSRSAIDIASESVAPSDFYKPAHGHIYEAVTSLSARGEPVDPVTVADELSRHDLLDAIGGPPALINLQSATPATSSAARYAKIVEEHSLLRGLIGVAGEIAEMGYDVPDDVPKAIDRAETLVFEIAQHRQTDSMSRLHDLLDQTVDSLEALYERGDSITGTPTGFIDFDELTSGLQPNALIVIGARPGMGKTSFAMGMAGHAAIEEQRPVLFFSLEMSRVELSQRLLCSEARVDSQKVRNGRLTDDDWSRISHAIGRMGEAPLWIDDNPNVTVMEIRAKARRLQSRIGPLGMIVVDYIQLMTGNARAENRQTEVAEISRGLKILARELQCPVVALAQLNRGLEQRADKRPMLSDLRESGCLTAGTKLLRADTNTEITLGELIESNAENLPVWSLDERFRLTPALLTHAFPSGVKPVFRMTLASGRTIEATANHKFRTVEGWRPLGDLASGSRIAVPRRLDTAMNVEAMDSDELVLLAHLIGDGCVLPRQPVHYTSIDPANLDAVEQAAARRFAITPRRVAQERWWHTYLPAPFHLTHGVRNPIAAWWDELGLHDCRSHQKFVPDAVHAAPLHQACTFLRHLWATDGTIVLNRSGKGPRVRINYATTSRRLADDVQRLLLRCGIQSRISVVPQGEHRPSHHVRIEGVEHQRRFLTEIGVHGERGARVKPALELLEAVVANPNADTIPFEVRPQIVEAMAEAGLTQRALASELGEQYCGSYLLGSATRPRSMRRARLNSIAEITGSKALTDLAVSDVLWDSVVSIEPLGEQPVFDATVLETHNFIADGIIAHNSLEQDADIVVFLYRDEHYNADSADRGTAEVLVAKHRAGPTGMIRLAFLDHYTKFANMARE
ncbi:replicative DNA helicase [Aquihabitans daechungensis]|uniref:replicative DNA helicase n=1 Tax=Aquihabitans daechungensis TaxID=1052257 RepID=UPI003BA30BB9